jgi:hypothetical protein
VADERSRIEIGFDGGQIMGALVSMTSIDELERRLENSEDGTVVLDADDGRYLVALGRVVYVKRFAREARVGFGAQ